VSPLTALLEISLCGVPAVFIKEQLLHLVDLPDSANRVCEEHQSICIEDYGTRVDDEPRSLGIVEVDHSHAPLVIALVLEDIITLVSVTMDHTVGGIGDWDGHRSNTSLDSVPHGVPLFLLLVIHWVSRFVLNRAPTEVTEPPSLSSDDALVCDPSGRLVWWKFGRVLTVSELRHGHHKLFVIRGLHSWSDVSCHINFLVDERQEPVLHKCELLRLLIVRKRLDNHLIVLVHGRVDSFLWRFTLYRAQVSRARPVLIQNCLHFGIVLSVGIVTVHLCPCHGKDMFHHGSELTLSH